MDVSIIIPNLNGGSMLLESLGSAFAQSGPTLETIVVDNGSKDGSPEAVERAFPEARVLAFHENLGFAPACNRGAAAARGRYLLFLNNDAVLPPRAVEMLVAAAEADAEAAMWQPVIVDEAGTVETAGFLATHAGFLWPLRAPPKASPSTVFAVTAACLLVRRSVFEALEGFREPYFAYFEDADLSWRARMAGWEVRVVADVVVSHRHSRTTRSVLGATEPYYLGYRNRFRSILANTSGFTLLRMLPQHIGACALIVCGFILAGRFRAAFAILRGVVWPLTHTSEILRQRRTTQAARGVEDRDVIRAELVTRLTPAKALELFRGNVARWMPAEPDQNRLNARG
ncbi:MAG TPA: glycosyltransferase family 2 protein [Actinomycetota bacterium]|jgi:GT2 family glycosyltransferase|nr:glycosyltransferase family 2 protein [Actinomycetota bacterium]